MVIGEQYKKAVAVGLLPAHWQVNHAKYQSTALRYTQVVACVSVASDPYAQRSLAVPLICQDFHNSSFGMRHHS